MGRNLQTTLAQELCNQLGEYNRNYFTLDDIANIERLLNIQIKIVAAECFNSIIYSGLEKDVKVYLYKNGNHFDTINSMTGLYGLIIVKNVINHIKIKTDINAKRRIKYA
jgi:hypothetical protein